MPVHPTDIGMRPNAEVDAARYPHGGSGYGSPNRTFEFPRNGFRGSIYPKLRIELTVRIKQSYVHSRIRPEPAGICLHVPVQIKIFVPKLPFCRSGQCGNTESHFRSKPRRKMSGSVLRIRIQACICRCVRPAFQGGNFIRTMGSPFGEFILRCSALFLPHRTGDQRPNGCQRHVFFQTGYIIVFLLIIVGVVQFGYIMIISVTVPISLLIGGLTMLLIIVLELIRRLFKNVSFTRIPPVRSIQYVDILRPYSEKIAIFCLKPILPNFILQPVRQQMVPAGYLPGSASGEKDRP